MANGRGRSGKSRRGPKSTGVRNTPTHRDLPSFRDVRPQPLARIPEHSMARRGCGAIKLDGFRALTYIKNGECRLVSRKGHIKRAPGLDDAEFPAQDQVDGEHRLQQQACGGERG
jgi:ATP-dependent DNA ligase